MEQTRVSGIKKVSLEEVMAFRERRENRRKELIAKYNLPLVCLGLNMPGEYKSFPWACRCFHEGIEIFKLALEAEGIAAQYHEQEEEAVGYTAYFSVDASSSILKTLALRIEETHLLGRLFDIDVHDNNGEKISRHDAGKEMRRCLVCGENAFACARSQSHTPGELRKEVFRIIESWLKQKLGDEICSAALWAMMSEAAITPKPGLVDMANSGSHHDMNFFTFIDSSSAIFPWFRSCAIAGFESLSNDEYADVASEYDRGESSIDDTEAGSNAAELFQSLRAPGRIAEVLMKKSTGGINTHKGYIFSLGILCAAYGRLYRNTGKPELCDIIEFSKAMTVTLGEDFTSSCKKPSHGQTVYASSGVQGIRGEVSSGFPTVTGHALPMLRLMLNEGYSLNDAGIAVMLKILTYSQDTNIIYRGDKRILESIQEDLHSFLEQKDLSIEAIREKAAALDRDFIARNLSPGGSADLLGTSFFLYRLLEGRV